MSEINYIVRVVGKDLNGTRTVSEAIQGLKGVGHRTGLIIANKFNKENKIPHDKKLGELNPEEVKKLEDIVMHPGKHGLPSWALNRRKDYETGEDIHLTMNELDFQLRNDFGRLAEIKSYRGLRHMWGLTVRGQKTKSTHRGKGGTVGVSKKDVKSAAVADKK